LAHRKYDDYHRTINNIVQKQCIDCKNWFDMNLSNFGKDKNNKDKHNERCKSCQKTKQQAYYDANREAIIQKNTDYFWANREKQNAQKLEYYNQHKDKFHEKHKEYCESNLEKVKEDEKDWRRKNPEKLKVYNEKHRDHDITEKEWRGNQEAFNNCCVYCGKTKDEQLRQNKEQFHKDHMVHDGYNDVRNSAPTCTQCNTSKHQYSIEEWYPKQSFFNQERLNKIYWWMTEGYKSVIEDKPPYRIRRKRIEGLTTYYWQLWSVDEMRNMIEVITIGNKKKDILDYIKENGLGTTIVKVI